MHIVGLDISERQKSKLRNGHKVRVKRGEGCNVIVNPSTFNLLNKSFGKAKGAEIALSPEEVELNRGIAPEQHLEILEAGDADGSLASRISGTGLFSGGKLKNIGKQMKRGFSKAGDAGKSAAYTTNKTLKSNPVSKAVVSTLAPELAGLAAESGISYMTGNPALGKIAGKTTKKGSEAGLKSEGYGLKSFGRKMKKGFTKAGDAGKDAAFTTNKTLKGNPVSNAMVYTLAPELTGLAVESGTTYMTGNPLIGRIAGKTAKKGSEAGLRSEGYGKGLYAGRGFNAGGDGYAGLLRQNYSGVYDRDMSSSLKDRMIRESMETPPIKDYYGEPGAPISRGTGLSNKPRSTLRIRSDAMTENNMNLIRGRGSSLISSQDQLPPALRSQPFGENFHFQYSLPPSYNRYNSGTDIEGNGMYA